MVLLSSLQFPRPRETGRTSSIEDPSLKHIKHILWDWNGTLVDDTAICVRVTDAMLREQGRAGLDLATYKREFTFPVINFYRAVGFDFSDGEYAAVSEAWIARYKREFALCAALHPEVHEALAAVASSGRSQAILSAAESGLLEASVRHFGLEGYFSHLHGTSDNQAQGKTALAIRLMAERGYDPAATLLFGDTIHDAEVAEAIGIHCILIAHGHQDRARLEATGLPVLQGLRDVARLLHDHTDLTTLRGRNTKK